MLTSDDRILRARVHGQVQYAIRTGALVPQPCEECGNVKAQAHHDDYSKPFNVRWLCPSCHLRLHAVIRATIKGVPIKPRRRYQASRTRPCVRAIRVTDEENAWLQELARRATPEDSSAYRATPSVEALIRSWLHERARAAGLAEGE